MVVGDAHSAVRHDEYGAKVTGASVSQPTELLPASEV